MEVDVQGCRCHAIVVVVRELDGTASLVRTATRVASTGRVRVLLERIVLISLHARLRKEVDEAIVRSSHTVRQQGSIDELDPG